LISRKPEKNCATEILRKIGQAGVNIQKNSSLAGLIAIAKKELYFSLKIKYVTACRGAE
jgi:hypothetical protein